MSAAELLMMAKAAGIILRADGDRLLYEAPKGTLTPELKDALVLHKPALLNLLKPVTEFITLKNGPTLPADAIRLAIDLEARGFRMSVDEAHQFQIESTTTTLTDADRAGIARWRLHLGAIIGYEPPEIS